MPSSSTDHNPVDKEELMVMELQQPAEVFHETLITFAITLLLESIAYIFTLWIDYYSTIFGEILLPSPLKFIIAGLAAFAEMKSQGSEFPFKTHPRSMNVAVSSLLFYGFASAAQHLVSASRLGPSSGYAIVAHSGRMSSLCVLVASVASLFYV